MRRRAGRLAAFAALAAVMALTFAGASTARAQEKRFDAETFRPSGAPRDLVMVQKSEVIGNLSPVVGIYADLALNPLVLVRSDSSQAVSAVAAGLTLTPVAGIGFFNWIDVTVAVPLVAWQTGGNLRAIGTEGPVKSSGIGDIRLNSKFTIPYFNRKDEVKSGFGMAVTANVNLPTGDPKNFMGDGAITGGPGLILDYRFGFGLLVALNGGVWIRPNGQFSNVKIGDMGSFGVGAEMYVLQRYGLSVIGEVYGYPSLVKFPESAREVPAEVLLGIRWQSKHGITITAGGSFGAACGFGAPAFRAFTSITWQPSTSREQDEINRLLQRASDDPDGDGLIGDADRCPNAPGPPENLGCPDVDTDGDGVIDRLDECPDLPGGVNGKHGCPTAYLKGDEIIILDQVHFATDKDIILAESLPVLDAVARVFFDNPEIREVRIEGHTDVRATDAYNMNLSQRRVNSVMAALVANGVDASRMTAKGFGHTQPVYDDAGCLGPDEGLSATCRTLTSKNRRVVFRIVRRGAPPPRAPSGADNNASVLPSKAQTLPSQGSVLPSHETTLPTKSVLPTSVLPEAGQGKTLPTQGKTLTSEGVLQRSGAPKKPVPPKKDAAPGDKPAPSDKP